MSVTSLYHAFVDLSACKNCTTSLCKVVHFAGRVTLQFWPFWFRTFHRTFRTIKAGLGLRPVHICNIVEATFDFVATNGNNVERNFVLSTKSKQIEHVQFVSTLSKGRNCVRHCCRNRQHCCQKRQQCRSNIRHCRKNRLTCSIRQCCFDIVASMNGA